VSEAARQQRKGVIGRGDLLRASALGVQRSMRLDDFYFRFEEPAKDDAPAQVAYLQAGLVGSSQVSTQVLPKRPKLTHLWLLAEREPRPRSEVADTPMVSTDAQDPKPDRTRVLSAIAQAQRNGVHTLARRLATRVRACFWRQADGSLDVVALGERIARAQGLVPAPRQSLRIAHAALPLVLDLGESMRPLHGALKHLATYLQHQLGIALCQPPCFDAFGQHPPVLDSAALLLSDGSSETVRSWLAQAPKAARLCISPVPMQTLPQGVLQLSLAQVSDTSLAEFLALLGVVPYCHAELLLPLAGFWCQGAEAWALAWAIWNHPKVRRDGTRCWCMPTPDAQANDEAQALTLPRLQALLEHYLDLHALEPEANRALARLYAASAPGLEQQLAPHRHAAEAYVEHLREQMQGGSEDAALLAAAFVRALPAAQRAQARYGQVFQLAHRTLGSSTDEHLWIPDGLQLHSVDDAAKPEPWQLRHVNDALVLQRVAGVPGDMLQQASLAALQLAFGQWLQWRFNGTTKAVRVAGDCIVLVDFLTEATNDIELITSNERLQLTRYTRPSWALSVGRDRLGAYVIASSNGGQRTRFALREAQREPAHELLPDLPLGVDQYGLFAEIRIKGVTQRLRWIAPGEFEMGAWRSEQAYDNESPIHDVLLTKGFWLADTACTQAFWLAVVSGKNPSRFTKNLENPVEGVSWDDITQQFLPRLQMLLGATEQVQLPSEAQWEYACRAGTDTRYSFGDYIDSSVANFGNKARKTVPVARFAANPWGLKQMHGNVWEWCRDGRRVYTEKTVVNPEVSSGYRRALRGGSWATVERGVRSACRHERAPSLRDVTIGFRFFLRSMSLVQSERPSKTSETT
jgi:formylglycine-generating enzyme